MNRDESRSRLSALPPEVLQRDELAMLYPREPSGGTWIGINSAGMAFALINWYSQPDCGDCSAVSRGEVVRTLLAARTSTRAASLLAGLPLSRMNPFGLMVISVCKRSLTEWRSSGGNLRRFDLPWRRHHWFSSGLDEAKANEIRRRRCERVHGYLGVMALRKLHRSHSPKTGPFSLCMHRRNACTVSYTEIDVRGPIASTYYIAGSPCSRAPRFTASIRLDVLDALHKVA
jgi:hypothetical protein